MARFEGYVQDYIDVAPFAATADALYELGVMYAVGREVELDMIEAHKWFNISASRGNKEARARRAELTLDMTKQDVAKAQRLAREWLASH